MGEGGGAGGKRAGGETGALFLCPTPIGNLGDITQRTLDALSSCDAVCAEDTRVTGKLLAAYGISKRVERLDEAMMGECAPRIAARVLAGERIAYCSDAGMPGVSDPGMRLVRAAREAGAPVQVLPGASAAATAYVASATASPRFFFGGFFPRKAGEQRELLESLASLDAALIFYESPNRLVATLRVLAEAFPHRELAVCRELTKLHEEILRDTAPRVAEAFEARAQAGAVKGEIVIVVDGPSACERQHKLQDAREAAAERAAQLQGQGMRSKELARILAEEFALPRNVAYEIALSASQM